MLKRPRSRLIVIGVVFNASAIRCIVHSRKLGEILHAAKEAGQITHAHGNPKRPLTVVDGDDNRLFTLEEAGISRDLSSRAQKIEAIGIRFVGYSTLEAYWKSRWDVTKRRVNQLIAAAEIAEELSSGTAVPELTISWRLRKTVTSPSKRAHRDRRLRLWVH